MSQFKKLSEFFLASINMFLITILKLITQLLTHEYKLFFIFYILLNNRHLTHIIKLLCYAMNLDIPPVNLHLCLSTYSYTYFLCIYILVYANC